MDSSITWKMRIHNPGSAPQNPHMDEMTKEELMDDAAQLVFATFGDHATDEHIEWAYQRLELHWRWGLPMAGIVTVH